MKQKLAEWGIQSPHLINATGLNTQTISGDPDGKEDENQLSAYDIAVIAKHLLQDFPEVTKYTSKPTALFSNTQIENPQPNARRHAELPFGSRRPSSQQLHQRRNHLCCINDAKWHPHDHSCPRS